MGYDVGDGRAISSAARNLWVLCVGLCRMNALVFVKANMHMRKDGGCGILKQDRVFAKEGKMMMKLFYGNKLWKLRAMQAI